MAEVSPIRPKEVTLSNMARRHVMAIQKTSRCCSHVNTLKNRHNKQEKWDLYLRVKFVNEDVVLKQKCGKNCHASLSDAVVSAHPKNMHAFPNLTLSK